MNKICFGLLAGWFATSALAETVSVDGLAGDAQAGQAKAATCVACHGQDGNSINGEWPKLAGQHRAYTVRQLQLYKSGGREDPIMMGMAAGLSAEDMADIASYYEQQTIKPGVADEAAVSIGERIYRAGDDSREIPACASCHGPRGEGNPLSAYPRIAGQHQLYSANALRAFRDGMVWGEDDRANAIMATVTEELEDHEIEALASFLEGLH